MAAKCTPWKKSLKPSGANPWERTCGQYKARVVKWKPGEWNGAVTRTGTALGHRTFVSGKTLREAKANATREMQRLRKKRRKR